MAAVLVEPLVRVLLSLLLEFTFKGTSTIVEVPETEGRLNDDPFDNSNSNVLKIDDYNNVNNINMSDAPSPFELTPGWSR